MCATRQGAWFGALSWATLPFKFSLPVTSRTWVRFPRRAFLFLSQINSQFIIRICLVSRICHNLFRFRHKKIVPIAITAIVFSFILWHISFLYNCNFSPSVNSMSQPLIATHDQRSGHRVVNLRHQWHSHWLKNQSDISDTYQGLPPVVEMLPEMKRI